MLVLFFVMQKFCNLPNNPVFDKVSSAVASLISEFTFLNLLISFFKKKQMSKHTYKNNLEVNAVKQESRFLIYYKKAKKRIKKLIQGKQKHEFAKEEEHIDSHFVPCVYLRKFYNETKHLEEIKIKFYNEELIKLKPVPKKAEQICYVEDLYKIKSNTKDCINKQMIETMFCNDIEFKYNKYYEKLMINIETNKKPFNIKERNFWIKYIMLQNQRTKKNIEITNKIIEMNGTDEKLNENEIKLKQDMMMCGTFYSGTQSTSVDNICQRLKRTHRLRIVTTKNNDLLTSDNPVITLCHQSILSKNYTIEEFVKHNMENAEYVLPISSQVAIILSPKNYKKPIYMELDNEDVNYLNENMVYYAFESIVAKKFNKNQIKMIERITKKAHEMQSYVGVMTEDGFKRTSQEEDVIRRIVNCLEQNSITK